MCTNFSKVSLPILTLAVPFKFRKLNPRLTSRFQFPSRSCRKHKAPWQIICCGMLLGGGGGGSLPLDVVPDARESPSKKHPKRGFNGIPKDKRHPK